MRAEESSLEGSALKKRTIAFGTDGVRGVANRGLTPEDALNVGIAAARLFGGTLVLGRDTRLSGGMLSGALAAGAAAAAPGSSTSACSRRRAWRRLPRAWARRRPG